MVQMKPHFAIGIIGLIIEYPYTKIWSIRDVSFLSKMVIDISFPKYH